MALGPEETTVKNVTMPRTYGPEYGLEAVRRLREGVSIVYMRDGILIEEFPDGRRYEIRVEADDSTTVVREL